MEKKSLDTNSTWGRALCRETGARRRDVPVRSVRFPCNGHGGRSPDRSPPIRALGGGDVLHAARQTVAAVARGGCVGGSEGRELRRRPPKGDDGDDGGRSGSRVSGAAGEGWVRALEGCARPKTESNYDRRNAYKTKCEKILWGKKFGREETKRITRPPEADKNIMHNNNIGFANRARGVVGGFLLRLWRRLNVN